MKKFAANYLLAENRLLLKNGIIVAEEDGTIVEVIDTKGDLIETELLAFHNGILIAGIEFEKTGQHLSSGENNIQYLIYSLLKATDSISVSTLVEMGKLVQNQFNELTIPEILNEIYDCLLNENYFFKKTIPGIFLLTGANLPDQKFTAKSRIRKLL